MGLLEQVKEAAKLKKLKEEGRVSLSEDERRVDYYQRKIGESPFCPIVKSGQATGISAGGTSR